VLGELGRAALGLDRLALERAALALAAHGDPGPGGDVLDVELEDDRRALPEAPAGEQARVDALRVRRLGVDRVDRPRAAGLRQVRPAAVLVDAVAGDLRGPGLDRRVGVVAVERPADTVAVVVGERHALAVDVDHVGDVRGHGVLTRPAVDRVGHAVARAEDVVAALAEQLVGAAPALQRVAALTAAQHVRRGVAAEVVVPAAAGGVLDIRRHVLVVVGVAIVRHAVEGDDDRGRVAGVPHRVDSRPAGHRVAERVRGEQVVPVPAVEDVERGAAGEVVVAALSEGLHLGPAVRERAVVAAAEADLHGVARRAHTDEVVAGREHQPRPRPLEAG
jgi:hypothetical protein